MDHQPQSMDRNLNPAQNFALALCAGILTTGCASTMGNIQLTQVGEQPCFAVADNVTNRRNPPLLHALVVTEKGQNPSKEVWGISMPNPSKLLIPPDTCIQYGQSPIGAQVDTPPMRLQLGEIYGGFINARPEKPSNRISFHTVEFCLIKDASGATKVHEIQWDKTQERWRYDVCKLR